MSGTVGRGTTAGGDFSYSNENGGGTGRGPGGRGGPGAQARGPQGPGGPQTADSGGFGQGPPPVAQVQRMLRLAANKVRLSFYERYGSSVGDAQPYSLTAVASPKIAYYRQRFGITLGGPLVIPKIYNGREKTFFFINYENGRNRDPIDSFSTVPTIPERGGDFTDRSVQLFDPASSSNGPRTPLCPAPCTVIPSGRLDNAALGLLQFVPFPTNLNALAQNYHLQARVPDRSDRLSLRTLHTISPKLNLMAFYNMNSSRPETLINFPDFLNRQSVLGQFLTVGVVQNWTPKVVNESRITFTRNRTQVLNRFAFGPNDIAQQLGITGVSAEPINFGVPQIDLTNFTGLNDPVPSRRRNQTLRAIDNASWNLSKHTIRAGLELARMENNNQVDPAARGQFSFTGLLSSQLDTMGNPVPGTGFDFADFLLGLPQATTVRFGSSSSYFRNWGFNGFISDDWRVHPRFTLTYGLRYDAVTPPVELFNKIANLDLNASITAVATVIPGTTSSFPGVIPTAMSPYHGVLPQSLIRGDYNKWAPRVALAWKPKSRITAKHAMTVRAGYSIFYNNSIYNQLDAAIANQPPFAHAQTLLSSTTSGLTLEVGFPSVPLGSVPNTVGVDPNYRLAYTQIWNFSTETQLTPNLLLELTYTGTKGTHLDLLRSPNRVQSSTGLPAIPNAPSFTYDTFGASSIYHALQVRVQKRMARGLMVQGVYTFAKSLDNASSIGGGSQVVVQDDNDFNAERGLSSFDIRHQFRLNYVFEFPFGERKRWLNHGWPGRVFNSWTLSGFTTVSTGTPFTARVLGSAANSSGTGPTFSGRADQVGDPNLPADQRNALHFFNTTAFAVPLPGQFGDAARNTITGPGVVQFNMALAKGMQFGKDGQRHLDARIETQNLLNHPNFSGLNTVVNSATYGRVQGTRTMRQLDISLRWRF